MNQNNRIPDFFKCNQCLKQFKYPSRLRKHKKVHESINSIQTSSNINNSFNTTDINPMDTIPNISVRKRKLTDVNLTSTDQPQAKLRKIRADAKKTMKLKNWKVHCQVLGDLLKSELSDNDWRFSLPDDEDITKLRIKKDGKIFDMDFDKRTVRPNMRSADKTWLTNFTKQSLTSKHGICIQEFSHNKQYFQYDKEQLKLFYLNIMEHVINIELFRGRKPAGIKKAKWNQ
eukprot:497617_1